MWFQGNLYQNRLHPPFFLLFWNKIADAACISLILAFNKIALLSQFSYGDETILKPPRIFQLQLIRCTFFSLAEQGGRGSARGHCRGWRRLRSAAPAPPGCTWTSQCPCHTTGLWIPLPGAVTSRLMQMCSIAAEIPVLVPEAPAHEWCPFRFTKSDTAHSCPRRRVPASGLWTGQLVEISSWWVKTRNIVCSSKH